MARATVKLTQAERVEHRVRELLAEWEYHRGSLPPQLVDALTKLRDVVREVDAEGPNTPRDETSTAGSR